MHIPTFANIVPVIVLLAVTRAEWEVFNGLSDAEGDDFNLVQEQLIPAEGAGVKSNKASLRNLASLEQSKTQNIVPKTDLKNVDPQKQETNPSDSSKSTANKETVNNNAKNATPFISTTRRKAAVSTLATTPTTSDTLDASDIQEEGFLLVPDDKKTRTSRKLTQFVELFSQDTQESILNLKDIDDRTNLPENVVVSQQQSLEEAGVHSLVDRAEKMQALDERLQTELETGVNLADSSHQEGKTIADEFDRSLKLACIDDTSWECLMFKEDYRAMKNLSGRISGRERLKRQASTGTGNTRASQNMSQVADCEQGDCFSGNGTDTGDIVVEPQFSYGKTTEMDTNRTQLDDAQRQKIANDTIQQLTDIFKNVPGFRNVTVDPDKITRTSDGELLIPWNVFIDGGDPVFSGMNGQQVRDAIADALQQAVDPYKTNFTIDNQHPKDDFNSTDAANQVQEQANDPCKMNPDPCPIGSGSCVRLPDRNSGIELKCIDNCYTYPSCGSNGLCQKDMAGRAHCLCSDQWAGLYCDRQNDNLTPTNQITPPKYDFTSQSKFNSTLKPADLTPEKRAEIAKNMTDQLTELQKNLPGFQTVTVDPNSIRIDENGQLVVDWVTSLDPNAYTGMNSNQIGDIVRDSLLNVTDTYRNSVAIDGQKPVEDFDAVAAADQIEHAASDPCSTNPCATGYGSCIAVSATSVMCVHNCNAIPVCQHNGTCQIDSAGSANCQCSSGWSGKSCEESTDTLDGGKIAGIVLGGALLTAGTMGSIWWFLLGRRSNDVLFTTYTDTAYEGPFQDATSKLYYLDRPAVTIQPDPLQPPSPYVTPGGTPSNSENIS